MQRQSVVLTEVEDFVKRFTSRELVLLPEAQTMKVTVSEGKNFLGRPKMMTRTLNDWLGHLIAQYQRNKDLALSLPSLYESAYALLDVIQRAYAYGVIRDVKQQTMAYEQEIEQLKKRLDACMTLNKKLTQENKTLHSLVPNQKKGHTEVGDVQQS